MKNTRNTFIMICIFLYAQSVLAHSSESNSYWECTAQDEYYQEWKIDNTVQRIAINQVLDVCKKQSRAPNSCAVAKELCESFVNGKSTRPMWRCVALDDHAKKWPSNIYTKKDDAAIAALDYCKEQSSFSDSCYINLLTCRNLNKA